MFDAHCHLDDPRLDTSREQILQRAWDAGLEGMILAGVDPQGWSRQAELAARYPGRLFVTYGVHPWIAAAAEKEALQEMLAQLEQTLASQREADWLVGLGEIGLDRSRRVAPESFAQQEDAFRAQLAMAREASLPVVLHVVQAHEQALSWLRKDGVPARGGMVHAFSGSLEVAKAYAGLGLFLSFGGGVTSPQAKKQRRAAQLIDEAWLLCETDAPDMLPFSKRGLVEQNEPAFLEIVLEELAFLRGVTLQHVKTLTAQNTKRLFFLGNRKR
ncbi:MAG: TatD family hydrolase [Myxococcales bacterium]|nr:TatD family hydrolase [Myxococcales bacterium]